MYLPRRRLNERAVVVVVVPAVRMVPSLEAVTGMQMVMIVQVVVQVVVSTVAAVVVAVELELVGPTPQLWAHPARLIVFVSWGCAARMQPVRANSAQWVSALVGQWQCGVACTTKTAAPRRRKVVLDR
jgi:hypothetical protein